MGEVYGHGRVVWVWRMCMGTREVCRYEEVYGYAEVYGNGGKGRCMNVCIKLNTSIQIRQYVAILGIRPHVVYLFL